ncbi:MAG: hypothetical protein GX376_07255 [Firmicutes bacterium]|nr:hypothetical protein [Bacillota bacterium]
MAEANKIVERILADAQREAEAIIAQAQERAAGIISEGEREAEKTRQEILKKAQDAAAERHRRIVSMDALEGRKATLAAKEALLEEAFQRAHKELEEMDTPSYQKVIRSLLVPAVQTGAEEVIIAPADQDRITPDFIQGINDEIRTQGRAGCLTLKIEDRPLEGGFILRSGGIDINNSFAALLKSVREELEPKAAAILFPPDGGNAKEAAPDG